MTAIHKTTIHETSSAVIDVRPLGSALHSGPLETPARTTLLENDKLKVVRLMVRKGDEISEHPARGDLTVQCLEGRVAYTRHEQAQELASGELLYLANGELHSLSAREDSSLLLTIFQSGNSVSSSIASSVAETDPIDEASQESFPASDAPSWTPVNRP